MLNHYRHETLLNACLPGCDIMFRSGLEVCNLNQMMPPFQDDQSESGLVSM